MEFGEWEITNDLNDIYRQARDLGLESNIAELDAYGFTVIENALSDDVTDQLADAVLRVAEERTGTGHRPQRLGDHLSRQHVPWLL